MSSVEDKKAANAAFDAAWKEVAPHYYINMTPKQASAPRFMKLWVPTLARDVFLVALERLTDRKGLLCDD